MKQGVSDETADNQLVAESTEQQLKKTFSELSASRQERDYWFYSLLSRCLINYFLFQSVFL